MFQERSFTTISFTLPMHHSILLLELITCEEEDNQSRTTMHPNKEKINMASTAIEQIFICKPKAQEKVR